MNILFETVDKNGFNMKKNVIEVLQDYFLQRNKFLRQLIRIELIDGKEEKQLYNELGGGFLSGQINGTMLSPKRLEFQIDQVINMDDDSKNKKIIKVLLKIHYIKYLNVNVFLFYSFFFLLLFFKNNI